jgi:uncharacterized protein (DUF58 family)
VTVTPAPSLRAYVTAGSVGLVAALAVGDPLPAVIGAVLLALGVVGLIGAAAPSIEVRTAEVPATAVEGATFDLEIHVSTSEPLGQTFVDLGLTEATLVEVSGASIVSSSGFMIPSVRERAVIRATIEPGTWGHSRLGPVALHTSTALGMVDLRVDEGSSHRLLVLPTEVTLKRLLSPLETNLHVGDLVSTRLGPGSEFADLRQFRPGDDPRSVNWRVSSRLQSVWVNERHPERNGDVVLLVDGQVEVSTELHLLVDRSIRLAAALLQGYGRQHHRLGLVTLDGLCRWVYPGLGELHRRHLLEQLMGVVPGEVIWEAAERAVVRVARRPSFVIVLTPLLNPEMAGLVHSLRRSGVDISVVALDVEPLLPNVADPGRRLGRRVWAMERDRLTDRLAGEGVPIAVWRNTDPPDVPLAGLAEWRSSWRRHG